MIFVNYLYDSTSLIVFTLCARALSLAAHKWGILLQIITGDAVCNPILPTDRVMNSRVDLARTRSRAP